MHRLDLSLHKAGTPNSEAREEHADVHGTSTTSLPLSQRHNIMFIAKSMEWGPRRAKLPGGSTKAKNRNSILIQTFKRIPIKQGRGEKKPTPNIKDKCNCFWIKPDCFLPTCLKGKRSARDTEYQKSLVEGEAQVLCRQSYPILI